MTTTHESIRLLEARVVALEEKEEVRALLARYCELADAENQLEEMVDLFDEEAVLVNPSGEHRGKSAISRYYQEFFGAGIKFSRHHILNPVIEISELGRATTTSYFIALLGSGEESTIAIGRYADELIKRNGTWRFLRKGNHVLLRR